MDNFTRPIDELSRAELSAHYVELQARSAAVLAKLLSGDAQPPADTGDRLLTIDEAAAALAVSKAWLYRRKNLGLAVKLGDGTLRYSASAVQTYIRESKINGTARRRK